MLVTSNNLVSNKGKFLMKELWAAKLEWDDLIPDEAQKKWSLHCTGLNSLSPAFFFFFFFLQDLV